jgi:hypothetical protein
MYMAWLCYRHQPGWGEDLENYEPEIKFQEPESWKYSKIIPIQFSVLEQWRCDPKLL